MSTGGTFTLINNDGRQDAILLATELLVKRASAIRQEVKHQKNWNYTISELSKTHTVFISGYYKPYAATGYEYIKTGLTEGTKELGTTLKFKIPQFGEFYSDMVVHMRLEGLRAVNSVDKVRYVTMLGHKIMKKVQFEVNNANIDEYTTDEYEAYWQFKLPTNKRIGYLRGIGQEIPYLGYLTQDPLNDEHREYRWIANGNQTFKRSHDSVDLWIPLLFWFKDLEQSFPSINIPYGRSFITLDLAKDTDLVSFADYGGGGAYTPPKLTICDLYINNIFILPEIHDLFMGKAGFSLIRVHRSNKVIVSNSHASVKISNLKWPIETLYTCFRPHINLSNSQAWNKATHVNTVSVPVPVVVGGFVVINSLTYMSETPVVNTLGMQIQGIDVYREFPASFFNNYIPMRFGTLMSTPSDQGWYMMNFNLRPGDKDPTGHINLSRAREIYISYTSNFISPNYHADMIVLADSINFMVVGDGNAVLKYST